MPFLLFQWCHFHELLGKVHGSVSQSARLWGSRMLSFPNQTGLASSSTNPSMQGASRFTPLLEPESDDEAALDLCSVFPADKGQLLFPEWRVGCLSPVYVALGTCRPVGPFGFISFSFLFEVCLVHTCLTASMYAPDFKSRFVHLPSWSVRSWRLTALPLFIFNFLITNLEEFPLC